MARSYPDIASSKDWKDIVVTYPDLANQRVTIQAKGGTFNSVYFDGAQEPSPRDGLSLPNLVSVSGTAPHIWVRGDCRFAILLED